MSGYNEFKNRLRYGLNLASQLPESQALKYRQDLGLVDSSFRQEVRGSLLSSMYAPEQLMGQKYQELEVVIKQVQDALEDDSQQHQIMAHKNQFQTASSLIQAQLQRRIEELEILLAESKNREKQLNDKLMMSEHKKSYEQFFSLARSQLEQKLKETTAKLEASEKQVKQLQAQLQSQVVSQVSLKDLVKLLIKELQSKDSSQFQNIDNELRTVYFGLKSVLQELCLIPLSDLEKIDDDVLKLDSMEILLMYYREKIDRSANDTEVSYWCQIRDREVNSILNSGE